jgi:hypothetical protein
MLPPAAAAPADSPIDAASCRVIWSMVWTTPLALPVCAMLLPVLRLSCELALAVVPVLPILLLVVVLPKLLPVLPMLLLPLLLPMLVPLSLAIDALRSEAQPASAIRAQATTVIFVFMMVSVKRACARIVWSSYYSSGSGRSAHP